jgi:DNA polymerase III subunit epsilon
VTLSPDHWARGPIAVLDFETTGLDPERGDRVVEVGIVHFDGGTVTDRWGTLIHPEMELPLDTTRITGIRPADVETAPRFAEVVDEICRRLEGRLLCAYNAGFDRGFLLHELARCDRTLPDGAHWIDPLVLAREQQKGQGNMKLGTVAKRLDIALEEAHRAVSDAECAGWVLIALAAAVPADLSEALDLHEAWEAAQNAQQSAWRNRRRGATLVAAPDAGPSDALGPGYPHGDELDPVRYMFLRGTGRL